MKPIAHIRSSFATKFGIPRQAGLVDSLEATVVFTPEFRNPDALRGLEDFSHLWLIWEFSQSVGKPWSPTVRPPRLGGNARMGVFATRSPFRPNPIGLSCVKLVELRQTAQGTVLVVAGADLMDGTPIYDIKPYIPYADSHPEAVGGFAKTAQEPTLQVHFPDGIVIDEKTRTSLSAVLALDPRPSYQRNPEKVYAMEFGGYHVEFTVADTLLEIRTIAPLPVL